MENFIDLIDSVISRGDLKLPHIEMLHKARNQYIALAESHEQLRQSYLKFIDDTSKMNKDTQKRIAELEILFTPAVVAPV